MPELCRSESIDPSIALRSSAIQVSKARRVTGMRRSRSTVMEAELRGFMLRKGKFHPLNSLVQLISQVLFNDGDQRFNLLRLQSANTSALQNLAHIVGPQERKVVPAFEIGIDPGRNCRKDFIERSRLGIRSQRRRNEFPDNPRIESIPGQPDA